MTEHICRNCRWWEGHGKNEWGFCTLADGGDAPAHPQTKAWASDSEGWSAGLNTKPDFGCVQWEEKESTTPTKD